MAGLARVYIDDIIVASDSLEACVHITTQVIEALLEKQLHIAMEKLRIGVTEVTFLGHIVAHNTVTVDPARTKAIVEAPYPATRKGLRSWLGMATFIRNFIPGFAGIAAPLHPEANKKGPLPRAPELLTAFDGLKVAISKAAALHAPKDGKPYELYVDASGIAVGAALTQLWGDEKVPIGFYSHKLTDTQTRWCATDREVYAIYWALTITAPIVLGSRLTVLSDHSALTHLGTTLTPKLIRYGLAIRGFGATIIHVKGKENVMADFLSRLEGAEVDDMLPAGHALLALADVTHLTPSLIAEECRKGPQLEEVEERNGLFFRRNTRHLYIPPRFRQQLMFLAHAHKGGHVGVGKTIRVLTRTVWWPKLAEQVATFIATCLLCQCLRQKSPVEGQGRLDRVHFNELVSLDYIGPRLIYGKKWWVLVLVEHYTRYAMGCSTEDPSAYTARDFVRQRWLPCFGSPKLVLTDNQPFNDDFSASMKELGVKHIRSLPHHPEGNGINESAHRLLEYAMKTYSAQPADCFEDVVQAGFLVHNAVPHTSTGESPFFLLTGEDPSIPGWDLFTRRVPEEERLLTLEADRFRDLVLHKLRLEKAAPKGPPGDLKVRDIVVYQYRQDPQKRPLEHVTGCPKWAPNWSLPCRILRFPTAHTVLLREMWSHCKVPLIRPVTEVRLLSRHIPVSLRQLLPEVLRLRPEPEGSQSPKKRSRPDSDPTDSAKGPEAKV